MTVREIIAKRAAAYFHSGDVVNLGIGIPGLCTAFSEPGVLFQTENGYLGTGETASGIEKTESYCNASAMEFVPVRGGAAFGHDISFGMIRGGRVDATVLGGLQVAENGDLANRAGGHGRCHGSGNWRQKGYCCDGALHKRRQTENFKTLYISADRSSMC